MKQIKQDTLDRLRAFEDTPEIAKALEALGFHQESEHLRELWTVTKKLAAEVRRLRK